MLGEGYFFKLKLGISQSSFSNSRVSCAKLLILPENLQVGFANGKI